MGLNEMNFADPGGQAALYKGTGKGVRLILYSHDTLGLGHIKRNIKIARALKMAYPEISILLITGSLKGSNFELPPGTDFVKLPSVKKTGDGRYDSKFSDISFEQTLKLRKAIIRDVVRDYLPHFFLADHSPLGMNSEILPALEWLADNNPACVKILGLRDIIDDPQKVKNTWRDDGVYAVLERLYDLILIYGTAEIHDLVQEYELNEIIRAKTHYIGYIADSNDIGLDSWQAIPRPDNGKKFVVITLGGGEWMGNVIIGSFLELLAGNRDLIDYSSLILTGPFIPDELWEDYNIRSQSLPTKLVRFVPETRPYIESADLVIATGGYNTITDLMSYGDKALVVPRIRFRQEQLLRAMRLSDLGLFKYIHPDSLNPEFLFKSIGEALRDDEKPLAKARRLKLVNLDGGKNLATIMGKLISKKARQKSYE